MSTPKITEKELAEKLESISASMLGLDKKEAWTRVAREAAELMGYEFTPEKPEPGTWHVVTGEGAYANQIAYVGGYGNLLVFTDNGDYDNLAAGMDWPELTPARIVPAAAAPVTLTEDQVGELWDEHRVDVTRPWRSWGVAPRMSVTRTVNAALAKHGGARELPGWDEVRAIIDGLGAYSAATDHITDVLMARLRHGDRG